MHGTSLTTNCTRMCFVGVDSFIEVHTADAVNKFKR